MPQPLKHIAPDLPITYEWNAIDTFEAARNIDLGALTMQCIESWSRVEMLMGRVFLHLLGGPSSMAANIYLSLETKGPKKAAIRAAASDQLVGDELNAFLCVLEAYSNGDGIRNSFAHGVFGYSLQLPDCVVLIPSKDAMRGVLDRDKAKVYRREDLRQVIRNHWRIGSLVDQLHRCLRTVDSGARAGEFARLSAEPEVYASLQRLSARPRAPE